MVKLVRKRRVCQDEFCEHRPESQLEVHGGITFSDFCQEHAGEGRGICHIPEPGEPEKVFWFGFDCAHCYDMSPRYSSQFQRWRNPTEVYRDVEYVTKECASLAKQLAAIGG